MAAPLANGTVATTASTINSNNKSLKDAERRRRRRKQKKKGKQGISSELKPAQSVHSDSEDDENEEEHKVEVEYVLEKPSLDELNMGPFIQEFQTIFDKFASTEAFPLSKGGENAKDDAPAEKQKDDGSDDEDEDEQEAQQKEKGLSNKKKKMQRRMKIAELKQQCSKPDVVEVWDTTAADPKLLVFLKAYRNTVPVPRHWCQKRKFLQAVALHQY